MEQTLADVDSESNQTSLNKKMACIPHYGFLIDGLVLKFLSLKFYWAPVIFNLVSGTADTRIQCSALAKEFNKKSFARLKEE